MTSLLLKVYQENRNERGIYDKRNTLNDLTGKEWLFSTKTVIPKEYPHIATTHLKTLNYNPIPIDLSKEIIETFTKPGDIILDPFAGIGSTVIGCHFSNKGEKKLKRRCVGLENTPSLITSFNNLCNVLKIPNLSLNSGNTVELINDMKDDSFDLIFCDIPIWDIFGTDITENLTITRNHLKINFRKILDKWNSFVITILEASLKKLKDSKYCVIAILANESQMKSEVKSYSQINLLISSILADNLQKLGLVLKAERISFIPTQTAKEINLKKIDRRLLIFRKETKLNAKFVTNGAYFENKMPLGNTYIIHKSFPPSYNHKLRSEHGGMKPPELAQFLIERFSHDPEEIILDPFVGVGGTLIGASLAGRRAIGIDINERWKEIYFRVSEENNIKFQKFIIGDSRLVLEREIGDQSIGLILTDVPYWAMDKLKKTRGRFSKAGEQSQEKLPSSLKRFNQSSIPTINEWIELLKDVFSISYEKLAAGKYLVVFIGNMYRTIPEQINGKKKKIGRYLLLSSMLTKVLLEIGYQFENEIIWYSPDKALHIFGYPYSYIPSIVHQTILVFKK